MRKPLVAGNWKMNKTEAEMIYLLGKIIRLNGENKNVETLICPPFLGLSSAHKMLISSNIQLGAQNMHWESSGAYTGEISPQMAAEFCKYVILGHSERREMFGDTDEAVNHKVKAALTQGLVPILCVGEKLEEKEAGITTDVLTRQIREGLKGVLVSDGGDLVLAYEPVWAIGTGLSASAADANQVCGGLIRPILASLFGQEVADQIRILYGGSVNGGNAVSYFSQPDIDGALVGGASLKADSFVEIVKAADK